MTKPPTTQDSLKPIVALCKRRGFIYPGSEIYGGFANTYSFGPYGAQLKKNIKDLWWKNFVQKRRDMVGLDGPILLHSKAWAASGHLEGFFVRLSFVQLKYIQKLVLEYYLYNFFVL